MSDMGLIKVEVNLSEIGRTVSEFRSHRLKALETLTTEVRGAVGRFFNQLLHTEMALFLGHPDQSDNKRNGYYERSYVLKGIGALRIRMPLDRKSAFKSEILPPREQCRPRRGRPQKARRGGPGRARVCVAAEEVGEVH